MRRHAHCSTTVMSTVRRRRMLVTNAFGKTVSCARSFTSRLRVCAYAVYEWGNERRICMHHHAYQTYVVAIHRRCRRKACTLESKKNSYMMTTVFFRSPPSLSRYAEAWISSCHLYTVSCAVYNKLVSVTDIIESIHVWTSVQMAFCRSITVASPSTEERDANCDCASTTPQTTTVCPKKQSQLLFSTVS